MQKFKKKNENLTAMVRNYPDKLHPAVQFIKPERREKFIIYIYRKLIKHSNKQNKITLKNLLSCI